MWATDPERGNVWRVGTGRRLAARAIPLEMWVAGLVYREGAVWATNEITDEIHRIDPRTSEAERIASDASSRDVDAGEGEVWVTAASPPSREAALPRSVCQDVQSGGVGRPDILLVSSLPLQGASRALARSTVGGIRFVLELRGFEAGGFSVGFQACDSSTVQAGSEEFFRCGSNAKAFSRNERVVGVVGSYQSFCSYLQIPITNQAPDGPLVMISPSNTVELLTEDDGLYRPGRGASSDSLPPVASRDRRRSSSRRNWATTGSSCSIRVSMDRLPPRGRQLLRGFLAACAAFDAAPSFRA